jgi:hypothetical protein
MSAATVGALLVGRLPRNTVGWLLLLCGTVGALGLAAADLADYGLVAHPGSLPGAIWLAWFSNWSWSLYITPFFWLLPLVFPTGRAISPRWRAYTIVTAAAILLGAIVSALSPFQSWSALASIESPIILTGPAGDLVGVVNTLNNVGGFVTTPLVATAVVLRYRRAGSVERHQLKWFLAVIAGLVPVLLVGYALSGSSEWLLVFAGLALLPVAIAIAILRYRLYDIDRLVSRSVSWGVLSVLLAGLFITAILALQAVFAPLTRDNEIAVAFSTLIVVAAFGPLQTRVQDRVDRRFNRSAYDAERTANEFAARIRDEVDVSSVRTELLTAVDRALEPTACGLWLRGA